MDNLMVTWLARGTSPVDWCEENYTFTPHIAELGNTISNVLFMLVPVAFSQFWGSYARHVTRGVHVVWLFFTIIGLSSAYFHATLSLLGQMLDELSILWLMIVSYSLFTPVCFRPKIVRHKQWLYRAIYACIGILITGFAFVKPEVNAYALFIFGAPAIYMLIKSIRAFRLHGQVTSLGVFASGILFIAYISWMCDKFLCHWCQSFNFTVLHAVWHILIFVATYISQVLFCYFYASDALPNTKSTIRYWPGKKFGLPYVHCVPNYDRKCP